MLRFAVLLLAGCVNLADKLILWPPHATPSPGITRRLVATPRGNVEVFVSRNSDEPPVAYVLRFYGNAEVADAEDVADDLDQPIEVWSVNYLGYGGSTGEATLENVAVSADAAYDELALAVGHHPIIAIGNGIGAAAALHVAARRRLDGLVLENPPPLRELVMRQGWWNLWLLARPIAVRITGELDSIANARGCTAPAVFLSSRDDSIVPPDYQQLVMDAYRGDWFVIDVPGDEGDPVAAPVEANIHAAISAIVQRARGASWITATSSSR